MRIGIEEPSPVPSALISFSLRFPALHEYPLEQYSSLGLQHGEHDPRPRRKDSRSVQVVGVKLSLAQRRGIRQARRNQNLSQVSL